MNSDSVGKDHLAASILLGVFLLVSVCLGSDTHKENPEAFVTFQGDDGPIIIDCEIADSEEDRTTGLMDKHHLENGTGMLFIFDPPREVSFWMKNTYIPLDMIFVSSDLRIINISEAEPGADLEDQDLPLFYSNGTCKYVVETNRGTSCNNGIKIGSTVVVELSHQGKGE